MFNRLLVFTLIFAIFSADVFSAVNRQPLGPLQVRSTPGAMDSSALFGVYSTAKGSIPCPKMTTTQRDAISSPTQGLCVDNTTTNKLNRYNGSAWVEVGSGTGVANYISPNDDAEGGTTGWATYADAAATSPVDGTGGSPNVTWTQSTANVLRGSNSFRLTKDAANRQGQGASYAFTIAAADKAKPLGISFEYSVSAAAVAGSDSATGDINVYVYDVTNSTLIQPTPYKLPGGTGNNWKYSGTFQASSNSTSYRLIFHVAGTNASAATYDFDSVSVSPQLQLYGAPINDWAAWTPTGSWSANTTYTAYERRVGGDAEYRVRLALAGAPTSASLTINLPRTIDTTRLTGTTANGVYLGTGTLKGAAASHDATVLYNSTTSVAVSFQNTGASASLSSVTQAAPFTFANGDSIELTFRVPISGWSSNVTMSQDADTRVVAAYGSWSSGSHTSTGSYQVIPNSISATLDTHGAWNSATSTYTAPLPGYYDIKLVIGFANNLTGLRGSLILVNGSTARYLNQVSPATGAAEALFSGSAILNLKAGDTIQFQAYQNSGGNLAYSTSAASSFSISRLSGPAAIAASEIVAARYTTAAGQSIPNPSSTAIVDFGTKDFDTHNAVTTGASWKFTAPKAAVCDVKGIITYTANATGLRDIQVFKNGSIFARLNTCKPDGTIAVACGGGTLVKVVAGDTLDIRTDQTSGGILTLNNSASNNFVSVQCN